MSHRVTLPSGEVRHEARWRDGGKDYRRRFRLKKDADAAELAAKNRKARRNAGIPEEQGPITYEELCVMYLAQHQIRPQSKRTLEERLAYSRKAFGAVRVRDLRPPEISRWNAQLPLATSTRIGVLKAMRQVLSAGLEWGYLAVNPARPAAVRAPKTEGAAVQPLRSWEEVEAVASHAKRWGPLIRFACATGLRSQEWQALTWENVDIHRRQVRVEQTVQDGRVARIGKTDAALRTVPLSRRALDALADLPAPLRASQLVFPNRYGDVVNLHNFRARIWHPALRAAGLSRRPPYQMRHTFATLALESGAAIQDVSRVLGHRDIQVTLRHYVRFLPSADDRFLAALDGSNVGKSGTSGKKTKSAAVDGPR